MSWRERVRSFVATGALSRPGELLRRARFYREFAALDKAFFYHRYATALFLAQRSGLLDALSRRERSVASLAEQLGVEMAPIDTLLRILDSQGWVERRASGVRLTPFAELFLADESPYSGRPMLELMGVFAGAFGEVEQGMSASSIPAALDVQNVDGSYRLFLSAVNNYLYWAGHELLQRITLPEIRSFIVGSMGVSFSAQVLQHFPSAKVTYGCLEHLVAEIPRLRERYGVASDSVEGCHAHGGDPQQDQWGDETFDLVFLTRKMILQPQTALGVRFARKAFEVLNPGGVAVFWEVVHPDKGSAPLAVAMEAVFDLAASPGAPSRTKKGFELLLSQIGFSSVEVVPCLAAQTSFVVASKPQVGR